MAQSRATQAIETIPGWRIFKSDTGRLWATREVQYDKAAEKAGAWRTVDADDLTTLCSAIAEQESLATLGDSANPTDVSSSAQ
ncbi:hypothetical protein [Sphaerisporangium rhizosphaerae]|uniref:Uncharacterized protein n=1 Tax=Sphaerisporangium rhizosphaerae TaxID=2269375 RepID=A0ABW2NU20_9ACTN